MLKRIAIWTGCMMCAPGIACAAVSISTAVTSNMTCAAGVCAPTSDDAALNVGDLETLLASGDVEVTTTGAGAQATDIEVDSPLTWANGATLALDAFRSIAIGSAISVAGRGGLTLTTNHSGKKGELTFQAGGNVMFQDLTSQLTIDGNNYALVGSISQLANGIASNPSGYFALSNAYDASGVGTYGQSPIPTTFNGQFEGLGNAISNLTINSSDEKLGLFAEVDGAGLSNIGLVAVSIADEKRRPFRVGALAGRSNKTVIMGGYMTGSVTARTDGVLGGLVGFSKGGSISNSYSSATVTGGVSTGGLVGWQQGTEIDLTYATGAVTAGPRGAAGGLVGQSVGAKSKIRRSFATGAVTSERKGSAGGLVGASEGVIVNSYAAGSVTAPVAAGGLVAVNSNTISRSYSTGLVGQRAKYAGGFVGLDMAPSGSIVYSYWDTTSSGITNLSQGAGNIANDPGITGLTSVQLQSGLPKGFSSKVWQENDGINNGLPYLTNNPPR